MDAEAGPSQLRRRDEAGESSYYPWRWRLEWLMRNVNYERSCSAGNSSDCWLIDELATWNCALRQVRLVLSEYEPGKLLLRSYDGCNRSSARNDYFGNENDGAFLVAWLPRKHACIRQVIVHDLAQVGRLSFVAPFIIGRAPNLQHVVLRPRVMLESECHILDSFGPPQCLHELELSNVRISNTLATKVAQVLRANVANLATLKLVGNKLLPESAKTLLLALFDCWRLRELTFEDSVSSSVCDAMAQLFRSNRTIREVTLVGLCKARSTCKHPARRHDSARKICLHCVVDLFSALEGNVMLQHFRLEGMAIDQTSGEAIAHLLSRPYRLETVALNGCGIDSEGARHIGEALRANNNVELLSLLHSSIEDAFVARLCSALGANKTLKRILLPEIRGAAGSLFNILKEQPRAKFSLVVHLPGPVSPSLACGLSCATGVQICHWGDMSEALCSAYDILASNRSLRCLHVELVGRIAVNEGGAYAALCSTLKASHSLQHFRLNVHETNDGGGPSVLTEIFESLASCPRLRQLSLSVPRLNQTSAQLLSTFVSKCRINLVETHIESSDDIPDASIDILHRMVMENPFLTKMTVTSSAREDVLQGSSAIDDAVQNNLILLNRATRFVLSVNSGAPVKGDERRCATAFEHLCGTASLLEHVATVSRKSQAHALMDVTKAKSYLYDNYMVLAGVVKEAVICWPGNGRTQIDNLNLECWRAVARHLKLKDIKSA